MPERITEVIVLAEDERQFEFVRRFLKRKGNVRNIRPQLPKPAHGSGEQYVRERYADEVNLFRRYAQHRTGALVVAIDADTNTVAQRERQLKQSLSSRGGPTRGF